MQVMQCYAHTTRSSPSSWSWPMSPAAMIDYMVGSDMAWQRSFSFGSPGRWPASSNCVLFVSGFGRAYLGLLVQGITVGSESLSIQGRKDVLAAAIADRSPSANGVRSSMPARDPIGYANTNYCRVRMARFILERIRGSGSVYGSHASSFATR